MQFSDLTKHTHLSYRIPDSFFKVVNFTPILQFTHNQVVAKTSEFDSELKHNNAQHKKYIFHYFIYNTCEILKKYNKKYKPVIFFNTTNELNVVYKSFLDVFSKKFPVIILQEEYNFSEFKKKVKCNGYCEELRVVLMRKLKKNQSKSFYFNKLQYFCKKYDLTFLDKTYFEDIRNKLSLL
ncbi:hypothetical protein CMI37_21335 [Candidatus Pacearchaeota archaeon]|nr:hypothetical protein [Candidatus Pacearchaeota archaeon]